MPVDSHLTWAEIRDFAAGLWTVNDQLMPPTAAQTMTDCSAAPSGGLRAWFKASSFPTTGIVSLTNESPRCLFAHESLINRSGSGTGNDYYLVTYDSVSTFTRIYRMDQTAAGPPVVWTLIKTTAAGLDPGMVVATDYITSTGDRYACFALGAGAGADNGVWLVKYSDGSLNHLTNGQQAIVANYQSRLIIVGSVANGNPNAIQFTDPGSLANILTNTAPVDIAEASSISGVMPFSPGDLLVFKADASIYLVQGDLDNYTVRQMNGSKIGGSEPVRGPQGVIFRIAQDGIYETPDGSTVNPLSKNIASGSFAFRRPIVWSNHWLMSFQAGGLVYDYDTGCWFTTSAITATNAVGCRLASLQGFMLANQQTPFNISTLTCIDGSTAARAESYTWKSAPMRDPNGRQVEIRSVEIIHKSTNGATSTIAVTVNGDTRTVNCDSSGRGAATFYFRQRRETLDIQVVAASNAGGVEAPRIEAVRIGSQGGHFLTSGSDIG